MKVAVWRVHRLQNDAVFLRQGAKLLALLQGGRNCCRQGVRRRRLGLRAARARVAGGADGGAGLWRQCSR